MSFKFSKATLLTALAAACSAFGAAFTAANLDGIVTAGEWTSIAWAIGTAVIAAFAHDLKPPTA